MHLPGVSVDYVDGVWHAFDANKDGELTMAEVSTNPSEYSLVVVRCSDGVLTELTVAEFAGLLRVLHGQKGKVLSGERLQRSPRDLPRSATPPPPNPAPRHARKTQQPCRRPL